MVYSVDNFRRALGQNASTASVAQQAPPEAPHATDEALGYWNGQAFVSWREWLASRPIDEFLDQDALRAQRDRAANPLPQIASARRSTHTQILIDSCIHHP